MNERLSEEFTDTTVGNDEQRPLMDFEIAERLEEDSVKVVKWMRIRTCSKKRRKQCDKEDNEIEGGRK